MINGISMLQYLLVYSIIIFVLLSYAFKHSLCLLLSIHIHITSVHILYTQAECALTTLFKTEHANHEIPTIEDIPLMSIDVQSEFLQFSKFLTKCG